MKIINLSSALVLIANLLIGSFKCDIGPNHDDQIRRELKETIVLHIDKDRDGLVSYEELKNYLAELHEKNIEFNVNKQWINYSPQIHEVFSWEGYEPETKQVLTWDHYFNQTYPELVGIEIPGLPVHRQQDTSRLLNQPAEPKPTDQQVDQKANNDDTNDDEHMKSLKTMARRADLRWKLADENGDTLLDKQEFKFLLHPDEGGKELQELFVREATEDMDSDKDGNISLDEFMKQLQHLASEQEKTDQNWLSSQQENFGRFLDKNKDGILNESEIKHWLVPAKAKKFEDEATRLLNIGDRNDDSKLSQNEILENYEQYISLIPSDYWQSLEDSASERTKSDGELVAGHEEL